jgi:hypothetical protein
VAQCVFYQHCRSVVSRLTPEQKFEPEDLERLTDHITRFSLAALREFAAGRPAPRSPGRRRAGHRTVSKPHSNP